MPCSFSLPVHFFISNSSSRPLHLLTVCLCHLVNNRCDLMSHFSAESGPIKQNRRVFSRSAESRSLSFSSAPHLHLRSTHFLSLIKLGSKAILFIRTEWWTPLKKLNYNWRRTDSQHRLRTASSLCFSFPNPFICLLPVALYVLN